MALLEDTVRLRDLPAAAWLVSSAFVHRRWQSRLLTLVGWPVFALTLLPAVLLGGAYWRDRSGLVLLYRWRPLADALVIVIAIVAAIVGAVALMVWWAGFVVLVALGVVWFDPVSSWSSSARAWTAPPESSARAHRRDSGGSSLR